MRTTRLLENDSNPTLQTLGFAAQVFQGYESREPDFHDHDIVEIFWVVSGRGKHLLRDTEQDLKEGDLGVIHFGQAHSILTDGPMHIINVYINPARYTLPSLPNPLCQVLPRIIPLSPGLGNLQNRASQFRIGAQPGIYGCLLSLIEESKHQNTGYPEAMASYLRLFFLHLARFVHDNMAGEEIAPSGQQWAIERIRRFLDEHWCDRVSLDELAERSRMSKGHLCRTFRLHTGHTVLDYVYQRRIEQAMMRLDATSEKVISISSNCGFGDLAHFNRVFRRTTGMTPTQYRKRLERLPVDGS